MWLTKTLSRDFEIEIHQSMIISTIQLRLHPGTIFERLENQ
jgi:hypothetical protein